MDQPWICPPCQAGDCQGCDLVDGRRAMLRLPMRGCACPRCADEVAAPGDDPSDLQETG
jgi:hypothetical protein